MTVEDSLKEYRIQSALLQLLSDTLCWRSDIDARENLQSRVEELDEKLRILLEKRNEE